VKKNRRFARNGMKKEEGGKGASKLQRSEKRVRCKPIRQGGGEKQGAGGREGGGGNQTISRQGVSKRT